MRTSLAAIAFVCLCLTSAAFGQTAVLKGKVVDDKENPVSRVRIITPGGQADTTDSKGQFTIAFSTTVLPGQATRIELRDKPGWVIYEPLLGNCVTQSVARNFEPLQVIIVRERSPLALSPKRLTQVIARWADERVRLRSQVKEQQSQLDEYAFLGEYAKEYGFTLEQFRAAADEWANSKIAADKLEAGWQEYWKKNYDRAAQLGYESRLAFQEKLKRDKEKRLEDGRQFIRSARLEGDARYAENKFREATAAYQAIEAAFQERELVREDFPSEWAATKSSVGNTKSQLGGVVEGQESQLLLAEAVAAYREALKVYTREQLPQDWAMTQNNLGNALSSQGERSSGEESVRLLAEAVDAYREALKVYTREQLPQAWAMTQNNLGAALSSQGERTSGEESVRLLAEAVAAYREALKVRTREQLPQDWAGTQNNLGAALQSQGERTSGEESVRLLAAAVSAFREALKVYLREYFPQNFAITQNNLAKAYYLLQDWNNAAMAYANVLSLFPNDEEAYQRLSTIYHERVFEYAKAYALHEQWLRRFPEETSAQADFAETHFTTGRFAECRERIAALLARPEIEAGAKIALRMIEIANLLALGQDAEAPAKLDLLIEAVAARPAEFKITWTFNGALHFIGQSEKLAARRDWLKLLFSAAEGANREAALKPLREAKAGFKP